MNHDDLSMPVRVGVIGTGWVAKERHIPAFIRDDRCSVTMLFDQNHSQAESVARKFRIPRFTSRLEDFLQEPLDVVSICTPPWTHASLIETVIRSGRHVLVEKPMTMTAEEGKALETLARKSGLILCPAHSLLFSRSMQRAKSLLGDGGAGAVNWTMGVQLSSWRRRIPTWFRELPGGLFFDEAPHFLYLTRHFLGELRVEQAWHSTGETSSGSPDERIEARLHGTQGTGHLMMWTGSPFSEWLFILFCSRAVLVLDLFRDILIQLPPERAHNASDVFRFSAWGTIQLWKEMASSGLRYASNRLLYGHGKLVNRFLDAVVKKEESPVTAQDGYEVVGLIEEILKLSARKS